VFLRPLGAEQPNILKTVQSLFFMFFFVMLFFSFRLYRRKTPEKSYFKKLWSKMVYFLLEKQNFENGFREKKNLTFKKKFHQLVKNSPYREKKVSIKKNSINK